MLRVLPLLLGLLLAQQPPSNTAREDEPEPGLPSGEAAPLPRQVRWELRPAITGETRTRQRITLEGFWRFAAVPERDARVVRAEMGWIRMPAGQWTGGASRLFDAQFRVADGLWRGKPLDEFPWAWAERDIVVSNGDVLKWINHRIFFVVSGPWARADVYVGDEQAEGVARDGQRWFEITELLIYPGTSPLRMRLHADAADADEDAPVSEPHVGLELLPSGPRVEAVRIGQDSQRGELEVTLDLMRPVGFPIRPGPPIRTIAMAVEVRLEDAATGVQLQKLERGIGTMPEHTRTVSLRVPWSASADDPPPRQARLRTLFGVAGGGYYDEPFPIVFEPAALPAASEQGDAGEVSSDAGSR